MKNRYLILIRTILLMIIASPLIVFCWIIGNQSWSDTVNYFYYELEEL